MARSKAAIKAQRDARAAQEAAKGGAPTRKKALKKVAKKTPKKQPELKAGTLRKPIIRRKKAGMAALKQIRRYQSSTDNLLPFAPFVRVVREVQLDQCGYEEGTFRWRHDALKALQEAIEAMLVREFEMTNLLACHAKRVTIQQKDMKLVQQLRGLMQPHTR